MLKEMKPARLLDSQQGGKRQNKEQKSKCLPLSNCETQVFAFPDWKVVFQRFSSRAQD